MAKVKNPDFSKIGKNNPLIYTKRKGADGFTHNVRHMRQKSKRKKTK